MAEILVSDFATIAPAPATAAERLHLRPRTAGARGPKSAERARAAALADPVPAATMRKSEKTDSL